MFKLFICLFLFIFPHFTHANHFAETVAEHQLYCAPQFKGVLSTIQQLPEVEKLISKALEEGPITIKSNRSLSQEFEGYWSSDDRTVYLTKGSESGLVTTLLFELHNAARDSELSQLHTLASQGQIKKWDYVEGVEWIEYQNALATSSLLNQGIEEGLFSSRCRWNLQSSFEKHFQQQKSMGHSYWIAQMYDQLIAAGQ